MVDISEVNNKKIKKCDACNKTSDDTSIHRTNVNGDIMYLCSRHYQLWTKYGKLKSIKEEKKERVCFFCGATAKETEINTTSKITGSPVDICRREYATFLKYGRLPMRKSCEFVEKEDYYEIHLFDIKGELYAIGKFSESHFESVSKYKWRRSGKDSDYTYYIRGDVNGENKSLHRLIMELIHGNIDNFTVDHIDRDGLNNLDENLRLATQVVQNVNQKIRKDNTSTVKGVSFSKVQNKWRARIQYNGIKKEVTNLSFEEAVKLRKQWELERDEYLGI